MSKKLVPYSVPPALQRIFIYSALAAFVIPVFYEAWLAAVQLPSNSNLSAYYWASVYLFVAPVLMFTIAMAINAKKPGKIFASSLMTVSGTLALYAFNILLNQVSHSFAITTGFWDWYFMQVGSTAVLIALYAGTLIVLKRAGRL